ncbi:MULTISPECIES: antibiotic biosynthesis monooxygenase [unclassified Rhizobium]|jgi:quinol monooxygenase YgiN|uniref:antibiotic biosynthesis monooxygenase n=1 Tax=unclassified Rhizobium TaxID=2613769 RepID=UPI000DD7C306|nr:antibiotic biosynthesis monooxygenase [Rhizobium sp. UBA1881]
MTTVFVRHEVSDYTAWRKVYDGFRSVQAANGVIAEAVFQSADNPNDITVTHEFATPEAAKAFMQLEELRSAMRTGGILGAPTVWVAEKV